MIRQKCVRWSQMCLVAGMIVSQLAFNFSARAQEESAATADSVVFSVVHTKNVGAIGAMAADTESDIWAVPSVPHPISLHFNGKKWKAIPMIDGGRMNGVAVLSPTDVWAVGEQAVPAFSEIQHFDGKKWTLATSPHFRGGESLSAIQAISSSNILAVGSVAAAGQTRRPLILHFDGNAWSAVSIPVIAKAELSAVSASSATDIWAVGGFLTRDQPLLTMHFDGNEWTQLPLAGNGVLLGVTALATNNAWAVGEEGGQGALIEHWDGTSWDIAHSPETLLTARLVGVSAISATDIWAAGCNQCGDAGAGQAPLIEHFDGTSWTINPAPTSGQGSVGNTVLTIQPADVFVGGVAKEPTSPSSVLLRVVEIH